MRDGPRPPRRAFKPRLLRQRDGHRRGGLKLAQILPPRDVPDIAPGTVKGCPTGRILAERPKAAAPALPSLLDVAFYISRPNIESSMFGFFF